MAIEAKWSYDPTGGFVPDLDEGLRLKLSALFSGEAGLERFLEAIHIHQHIYIIGKEDQVKSPTPAEMKKAAEILARDAEKLIYKLSRQAGGLKPHLDYYIMKQLSSESVPFGTRKLESVLEALVNGCQRFIEFDYSKIEGAGVTPEKVFAWRVANLFKEILNQEPRKYIPADLKINLPVDERKGKYARALSACFTDANGFSPGNLKEIVSWGIDHSSENK